MDIFQDNSILSNLGEQYLTSNEVDCPLEVNHHVTLLLGDHSIKIRNKRKSKYQEKLERSLKYSINQRNISDLIFVRQSQHYSFRLTHKSEFFSKFFLYGFLIVWVNKHYLEYRQKIA